MARFHIHGSVESGVLDRIILVVTYGELTDLAHSTRRVRVRVAVRRETGGKFVVDTSNQVSAGNQAGVFPLSVV